ncbi:MAG: hypothetical protein JO112_16115, partial [Planctomycetes bacterium]|nr:hypothetical protein [Planctomycetota bacterium]
MAIAEQEQSLSLWHIQFPELYERHLCRHSQFGLNVNHLVSVAGTYLALMGIVFWLSGSWWVLAGIAVPYLALLVVNVPFRVWLATVAFLGLLFGLFSLLPQLPIWVYPIAIVVFHRIQIWGHKVYTMEKDMTE